MIPYCHTLKSGCKGDVCLIGEKPDKELPGIGRGAWRYCRGQRILLILSCMMSAWLILFCASHSSRVLTGVGLVGGTLDDEHFSGFVGEGG